MAPRRTTQSKRTPAVAPKILSKKKVTKPPTRKRNTNKGTQQNSRATIETPTPSISEPVPVVVNPTDPLAVLDDLCFDLILRYLNVQDLLSLCAVSRLWRRRMDGWILNSQNRLREIYGIRVPGDQDPTMKPDQFLNTWKWKASIFIRKKNGQPTKAMKIDNNIHKLLDTCAGFVTWIHNEKPPFKYLQDYEMAMNYPQDGHPFEKYHAFEYATLCVQQPITSTSITSKPGEIRAVRFQNLIPKLVSRISSKTRRYRPLSLKLWQDPSSHSRILAIIQALVVNLNLHSNDLNHPRNGRVNVYLTIAVDISTLKTLWCIDNLNPPIGAHFGLPVGPPDATISKTGAYTMVYRDFIFGERFRSQYSESTRNKTLRLLTFDVLDGKLRHVYENLPQSKLDPSMREAYFDQPPRIITHPSRDLFFLPSEKPSTILVVTKSRTYELTTPNVRTDSGNNSGPLIHTLFRVSFDSSQSLILAASYQPEFPMGLNPKHKLMVQFTFTYDIPGDAELEALETQDEEMINITHLFRLRRARQFVIPHAVIKHKSDTGNNFIANSFDLENRQMVGFLDSGNTIGIFSCVARNTLADWKLPEYVVIGGPERICFEKFQIQASDGVAVTTRGGKTKERGGGKGKGWKAGLEIDDGGRAERRQLPAVKNWDVWVKMGEEAAVVWQGDEAVWLGFGMGCKDRKDGI